MTYQVEITEISEQQAAVVSGQVAHDGIAAFLGEAFTEVMAAVQQHQGRATGPPFARYALLPDQGFQVQAGFPVEGLAGGEGRVELTTLPAGSAATTVHTGEYAGVAAAYQAIEQWMTENGYQPADAPWESYLDEPGVAAPRTAVYFPCRRA